MATIQRNEFREIIGWNCTNHPYCDEGLRLVNGLMGKCVSGTRIGKGHYNLYYKYDVMKDAVLFPIIITEDDDKANKCFIANSREELVQFVENPEFTQNFEIKKEKMVGSEYKEIRNHEVSFGNRIPFTELYSWSKEEFYGYQYAEF